MSRQSVVWKFFFWVILFLCSTEWAFGTAMDYSSIGVKSWGMASAVTGIADDSSAVHWNPAGLVFNVNNGKNWFAQVYGTFPISAHMNYRSEEGIKDTSESHSFLPGLFISKTFSKWAIGYGNYLPYASGGADYEKFQNTQYDINVASAFFATTVAAAYKISPKLAVGTGISSYYAYMKNEMVVGALMKSEYKGFAGFGIHAGLLYKPTQKYGIGLCVRGPVDLKYDGEVVRDPGVILFREGKYDSEVKFTLPYYFILGFGFHPTSQLTIGFDIGYMLFENLDEIEIKTEGEAPILNKTYYTNMWRIGLGMDYKINKKSNVLLGIKYNEKSCTSEALDKGINREIPLLLPPTNDMDMITLYNVFSYDYSEKVELSFGLGYTKGIKRELGSQEFDQDIFSSMVGSRFRF